MVALLTRAKSAQEKHGEFASREDRVKLGREIAMLSLAEAREVIAIALKNHPFHWVGSGPGRFSELPEEVIPLVLRHLSRQEQLQLTSTCRDMLNVHAHLLRSQPEMTNAIGFKRQLFMPDSLAVDGLRSELWRLQKRFIGLNPDPALTWTLTLDLKTVQIQKGGLWGEIAFRRRASFRRSFRRLL